MNAIPEHESVIFFTIPYNNKENKNFDISETQSSLSPDK